MCTVGFCHPEGKLQFFFKSQAHGASGLRWRNRRSLRWPGRGPHLNGVLFFLLFFRLSSGSQLLEMHLKAQLGESALALAPVVSKRRKEIRVLTRVRALEPSAHGSRMWWRLDKNVEAKYRDTKGWCSWTSARAWVTCTCDRAFHEWRPKCKKPFTQSRGSHQCRTNRQGLYSRLEIEIFRTS